MRKASELSDLIKKIKEEQDARKADVKEFVETVEAVISQAIITQPIEKEDGSKGETYIRLSLNVEIPHFDQNGEAQLSKSLLLFKNQVIQAMLDNPDLAIYANMAYLSSLDDKGLSRISTLLAKRKITIAFVQLDAGDNYVDPATGIKFDTTTDKPLIKYSIVSIE